MTDKRPSVESDHEDASPTKRRRATSKRAPPLYKATVIETADFGAIKVSSSTAHVRNSVMLRIQKLLDRVKLGDENEADTKKALVLANRLMQQNHVSQAEVLAHAPPEEQRLYAGRSVVAIERFDGDLNKRVLENTYVADMYIAMRTFFGCKSYTTSPRQLVDGGSYSSTQAAAVKVVFYGIAENTVAAANAFEAVYNQAVEWARPHKGQVGKNSYCRGLANELYNMAIKEKEDEEARAKQAEEDAMASKIRQEDAERQAQIDRLRDLPAENPSPVDIDEGTGEAAKVDGAADIPATTASHRQFQPHVEDEDDEDEDEAPASSLTTDEAMAADLHRTEFSQLLGYVDSSDEEDNESELDASTTYDDWNGFEDENEDTNETVEDYRTTDFYDEDIESAANNNIDEDVEVQVSGLAHPVHNPDSISPAESPELWPVFPRGFHFFPGPAQTINPSPAADARPTESSTRDSDSAAEDQTWKSHMQLISYRDTENKIAENYLKENNLKVRQTKARVGKTDWDAYEKGQKDSKKIDIHRKRIDEKAKFGVEDVE